MTIALVARTIDCPCGGPGRYDACCEPLHDGVREAATAEELMRSRYSAYARGRADYVFRTWHPRTRPDDVTLDERIRWTGLAVTAAVEGGAEDDRGEVTFSARYDDEGQACEMHERSRFERRAGRWFYLDGDSD